MPSSLNLDANTIKELVDFDQATFEPPVTMDFSLEDLPHPGCRINYTTGDKAEQKSG